RHHRLMDEEVRFDFRPRLQELARFEAGEDVPAIPPIPTDPREARRHDYQAQCRYYIFAVIAAHLGIGERPDPAADMQRVVDLAREIYFGAWWQHYRQSRK